MSPSNAYELRDIAAQFSEVEVARLGPTRCKLLLQVAEKDRPPLRQMAETAEPTRTLEKAVRTIKHATGFQKASSRVMPHNTGRLRSPKLPAAVSTAPAVATAPPLEEQLITIAIRRDEKAKLYAAGVRPRRRATPADMRDSATIPIAYARIRCANKVRLIVRVHRDPAGDMYITTIAKREEDPGAE